jgi:hypothetical protein
MAPQMMLALKNTSPLGQEKLCACLSVQMPLMFENDHWS